MLEERNLNDDSVGLFAVGWHHGGVFNSKAPIGKDVSLLSDEFHRRFVQAVELQREEFPVSIRESRIAIPEWQQSIKADDDGD